MALLFRMRAHPDGMVSVVDSSRQDATNTTERMIFTRSSLFYMHLISSPVPLDGQQSAKTGNWPFHILKKAAILVLIMGQGMDQYTGVGITMY